MARRFGGQNNVDGDIIGNIQGGLLNNKPQTDQQLNPFAKPYLNTESYPSAGQNDIQYNQHRSSVCNISQNNDTNNNNDNRDGVNNANVNNNMYENNNQSNLDNNYGSGYTDHIKLKTIH